VSSELVLARPAARRHPIPAILALLLAGAAAFLFWRDQTGREEARTLLVAAGLAVPTAVETVALLDAADLAQAFAVETALADLAPGGDATGASVRLGRDTRGLLRTVEAVAAGAARERPGSAHHRMLLAEAAYAVWDLDPKPEAAATTAWGSAFQAAEQGAPGFELVAAASVNATLAAWPRLTPAERDEAVTAMRRAFGSREFARRAFPDAWRVLGARSLEVLPDEPEMLAQASAWLRAMGESKPADQIDRRLQGHPGP
jgi:hypothetical protein